MGTAASAGDAAADARPRARGGPAASVRRAAHGAAPSDVAVAPADELALVLVQLRKAQLFLRAREPERAIAGLDELDARVPAALLRDERDVARALALCDAGSVDAASALSEHVLARAPDSAYAVSLRESCARRGELLQEMRQRTSKPAL